MQRKKMNDLPFNEEKFLMHNLFREKNETVFVLNFKPGQEMPVHKHPGNLYLLGCEGEGVFIINGVHHPCKKGYVFQIEPDEEFGAVNNSEENFSVYAVMSKRS
ncbi:cupin domain-containing protein [Pueribacillus theae]|nr:cupin domain-containing protein [Pueribacillus theae]